MRNRLFVGLSTALSRLLLQSVQTEVEFRYFLTYITPIAMTMPIQGKIFMLDLLLFQGSGKHTVHATNMQIESFWQTVANISASEG